MSSSNSVVYGKLSFLVFLSFYVLALNVFAESPSLSISDVVPSELLQSAHHRIENIEFKEGMYQFTLDTDFGTYIVSSIPLLRTRVDELIILGQAINQFAQSDDSLRELPGQLRLSADSAIDIISRPVSSATNLAGQLASNLNETLTSGLVVDQEKQRFQYGLEASEDPTNSMHKRIAASQWGLDVYSSNPKVQDFLNAVAKARSSGKISSGTPALSSRRILPDNPDLKLVEAELDGILKHMTVAELHQRNDQLLKQTGMQAEVRGTFLNNMNLSPRHKTRIVSYLQHLEHVRGLSAFLRESENIQNETLALRYEKTAMMLVKYHLIVNSLQKIFTDGEVLQAINMENKLIDFNVDDMLYWSEAIADLYPALELQSSKKGFKGSELVALGKVSKEANLELKKRQYVVRKHFLE